MIWLIVFIVYVILGIIAYKFFISKWDNTSFEKVWFSCVWITLIPLYCIHYVHNKEEVE